MYDIFSSQRLIWMIGLILLVLGLGSCNVLSWDHRPEPDMSVLTGQPCAPPCWQGITPGVTSETEALEILHTNPITKNATIEEDPTMQISDPRGTQKAFRVGATAIYLITRNKLVALIEVKPQFQLTLGQIIGHYGTPEKFAPFYSPVPDPNWQFYTFFFYPRSGLIVVSRTSPRKTANDQYIVTEDMLVVQLYYFLPGSMDDVYKVDPYHIVAALLPQQRFLREWEGFGPVDNVPLYQ